MWGVFLCITSERDLGSKSGGVGVYIFLKGS